MINFNMNESRYKIFLILLILLLIGGWFYWFQIRPSNIRQKCYAYTLQKREERINSNDRLTNEEANNYFRRCLVENGLKAEDMVK